MILKASQRAGAKQLAVHLLREDDNDHIEIHEIRGFAAADLKGALREAYAVSRGTRCRQYLFSVSLNPPENEKVPIAAFEQAINAIEARVGLKGQPRVIVFHEKNGRRHAHCVWSRIDADALKAVNLPHFKLKLKDISRDLYIEHGWKMPEGLVKSEERNPLNFSREEWQQARRIGRDPRTIKEIFQDCWAISDSRKAFQNALEGRGYYLAKGDRRGFVAVDYNGEIYSVTRWTGIKTKDVAARLGDPDDLPSVDEVKAQVAAKVVQKLDRLAKEMKSVFDVARSGLLEQKKKLVAWHRHERKLLQEIQTARWLQETSIRTERFRKGLKGLWDRLSGRHTVIKIRNEQEALQMKTRDDTEKQALIDRQLDERRALQRQIKALHDHHESELKMLGTATPIQPDQSPAKPAVEADSHKRQRRKYRQRHAP
jgi:hypothetical protein